MRIAINTRFLLPHKMEGFGWYTYEVSKRLVEQYPQHDFYFFFDRPFDKKFIFGSNVHPIVLSPPARHPILFYIWFEWSVKRALKKYNIDLFFSPDGYLSLGSTVPQVGVIHDLNFEHFPEDLPSSALNYLKKFFPKFARKATKLITVSDSSKQDIIEQYGIAENKITTIWNGVSSAFKAIPEDEQSAIKDKYTGGEDYFLFVGAIHPRKNLKRLIEAYISFKQTSTSSVKLVIVGEQLWKNKSFSNFEGSAFSKDIVFTGHLSLEELTKITASAKILTYVPYFEGFGIPLVEAMSCGTPILAGNLTSLPEVAGDAALYCNPMDVEDITAKLIELDSNVELRDKLSLKGLERSKLFSWDQCAKEVALVLELDQE